MSHENSQFDIPAIQLRESKTQPRVSLSREIGEAQITHTIFGRAKVRIIRKGDQARRNTILAAIAVAAVAAAAWQGWFSPQQTEPEQSAASAPAASVEAQVHVPASQPENIAPPAIPPSVKSEPVTPPAAAITPPVASQKIAPQQSIELKDAGQKTAVPAKVQPKPVPIKPKAVPAEPLKAGKPPTAPAAANKDTLKNQADMPVAAKPLPAKRSVTPAVVPSAAAQPAASSPAAVVPPGKEDFTIQSPVDDKQLSAPISAPGK
jgi:hypothetical protein